MANETETNEHKTKNFSPKAVNDLGAAIAHFIPTYKKFAKSCRQALNSCLIYYSEGKFTVDPAETFKMDEPEYSQSEAFIGWFPVFSVKTVNGKKCRDKLTGYSLKMEAQPEDLLPTVTAVNTKTGDDISGDFSESTFKAIAGFIK